MDVETLFTEQRWNILSALSEQKFSPLQLAQRSNTSMANISQQLKLLEISNLVKKEKIANRDKGKPRSLFSLSDDYVYLISSMKGYANKRLIKLDNFQKITFRICFIKDQDLQYYLGKFIYKIVEHIPDIGFISIKEVNKTINVLIGSDNPKLKISDMSIRKGKDSRKIKVTVTTLNQAKKMTGYETIYDLNIGQGG